MFIKNYNQLLLYESCSALSTNSVIVKNDQENLDIIIKLGIAYLLLSGDLTVTDLRLKVL